MINLNRCEKLINCKYSIDINGIHKSDNYILVSICR